MSDRSVVLAGGGVAGIAWLIGVLVALREAGVDLGEAQTLVGTSAGSAVAAQLATGVLDDAARMQQDRDTAERAIDFDMDRFQSLAARAVDEADTPLDAARAMANLPSQQHEVGAEQRRSIVAARLPVQAWPERELRVCAVAQDTGERVVFERHAGVPLVDAVAASCAVPGVWPPVEIAGRNYVDGGVASLTNADVAPGADRTVVLVPTGMQDAARSALEAERRGLASSFVLEADGESIAAFGPNPLDPARRPDAFAAGRRQGAAAAAELGSFWHA